MSPKSRARKINELNERAREILKFMEEYRKELEEINEKIWRLEEDGPTDNAYLYRVQDV